MTSHESFNATLSKESVEWAASVAITQWLGDEGDAHDRLLNATTDSSADIELFRKFLTKWGIARHSTYEAKVPLFRAYVTQWRPVWRKSTAADSVAFHSVEEVARTIKDEGWSTSRLTSLASKLAFMSNPTVFVPYDKTSRRALRKCGFPVKDHDYRAYMEAFVAVRDANADVLHRTCKALIRKHPGTLPTDLMLMRVADKALMYEGGFRPKAG